MYGFQGNNSQSYNYQNPNGSFGSISQYAGPYYPYYSNATAAYNAFPSNETPCSSLGIIPQEYNQTGNGIPRPYFYDTNSSYPRPYQGLPFNQSVDIPIANSFNACPRNCHCCEPLKPKYFNSSNAVPQQASVKNPYDPTLNAAYNGLRKSFDTSAWRECNPQMPNLKDANDSAAWSIPKYGNGYKTETCPWPLPQRQTTKFEGSESLGSANNCIISQQNQRIALPNSQTYSNIHPNSLRPAACPSPGKDLLGSSLVGYQRSSFSDLPQNNSESHSHPNSSVNSVQTSSRTTCNLPYGGSLTCRYSTSTSQVINENQKCVVETPTVIAPSSGTLVDSFQRRFITNNMREEVKDNSYYHSGVFPSANSINVQTRRVFNAPNESDATFRLNCDSNESINPVAASRLQLPPIQSLRPSNMLFRHSSRDYTQDHSHPTTKSGQQNLNEVSGTRIRRSISLANAPIRNLTMSTTGRYCNSTHPETFNKTHSEDGNNATILNGLYGNQYMEEQKKDSLSNSRLAEDSNKLNSVKNSLDKHSSSNISSGISDLRHFLSTWDDVDEEDSPNSAQDVVSGGSKGDIEIYSEEISIVTEYPSNIHKQSEDPSCSRIADEAIPVPDVGQKEFSIKGVTYAVDHAPQYLGHSFESVSFSKSANINETEITDYEPNTTLKNDTNKHKEKKEKTSQHQAKRSFSYSELSTCSDLSNCGSSSHPSRSVEAVSHGCMSFLDLNTCESEVSYRENVPSEERIFETLKRKKDYKEILHSSDGKSLKILSLDLAVQGSSVTQNKNDSYKIQSCMESPKKETPVMQKTFFSCQSKSVGKNLDLQNGIIKETDNNDEIITPKKGSAGTSNKAKSESISLESDKMVFYNLTARVDVTLERLEVPSMSINERNDCSSHMLMSNSQAKRTQALEPNNMKRSKSASSEMNQTFSKEKEKCSYLSYVNDEVHPDVIKETDHDFEVSGSSFANDGDKSMSTTEDSVVDCVTKKSCLILPADVNESSIDKQKVWVEHDNGDHERCLLGGNGIHESEDEILSPEVQNVPEIPGKEVDENERITLESVETDNFGVEDIIYEVKGISKVHNRYADECERTSPCPYRICEFEKTELITEAISVPEMSKKEIEKNSLDNNEIDVRLLDQNKDITKVSGKEANEHERSLLESNEIHHLEEIVSVVEVVSISEMPIEKDVTERSLLANNVTNNVRGAETVTDVKNITEMSVEEADEHEKSLKSNDIFSVKEIESVAKVKSLSEGPIELNEIGESLIDNVRNVVQDFKGLRASPECLDVPERLRKETDEPSFKISHSCGETKAKYSVPESKDGQKHSRSANKVISRCFRKTTCNAILSIRKKYHYFHLRKDRKKSHTEIIHMIRSMKKNTNIKCNSNVIPRAVAKRNIKNKRNLGTNHHLENDAGDHIISDSKDVDMVSYEGKGVITDNEMFNECIVVTESVNTLPATSCFSKRIIEHEGLTSSQYLCCSDNNVENDGESAEENGGNVILNAEEKAIALEGLGESCVIGNVEVFMGIEGGEVSTIEEKESSFALGPPIEEILKEDTMGVQYWDSFELDNSLGVAMEVEVGSEIEGNAETVLLDHDQVEGIADSVSNDKSICLAEGNLDTLLLQASSSLNRLRSKKMDWNGIVVGKKDICRFPSKREEVVCLPDNGKCVSFHEKGDNDFSDSTDVVNDTDLNLENAQIFDDVEPTKTPSPIYIFTSVSKNYSKPCQDTSFPVIQNNDSDKNKTLEMKGKESVEVEPFKTENDYTSPDIKGNSFKTGTYVHSLSNLRQFQHSTKRKTVIEEEKGTDMRSYKLCSLNLSSRKKSWVKNESSAHFFTSKTKMVPEKKKRSVARKNIESHDGYIVPIGEAIIDGFYVEKDKSCEESGSEVDSAKVYEEEGQVKDNACNTSSKCRVYEVAIGASKKKSESKDGKNSSFYKKNLKEYDIPSKKVNYRISVSAKMSENNQSENLQWERDDFLIAQDKIDPCPKKHVSGQKRENERKGSCGCLQKLKIKVKEKKNFPFSAGRASKNHIISQSHLHKFARYGFWKARKWPYNCILNKRKPLKKPSKTFDVPEFCDLEKNTLPLILESYPNPPFLSPLPAYSDTLVSDTHNLTFSSFKSSTEKHRNEELSQSIHSQCSEQPLQSKSAYPSLCTSEDSKISISSLPVIDSNKITNFQYSTPFPVTKYKSEVQIMSASPKSKAESTKDTKNNSSGDMQSASPHKLQENNFSISSNKILGSEYLSNDNPHVCITFKKVGIADRNEKWMKTSIQDEFSENQEARKEQFIQNRIDCSFESPLPKVTIKKKNGEGGYQSFLSGFSSYLPLQSPPVTPATHFLIPPNSEDCDAAELKALVQETHHAQGLKSKSSEGMTVSKSNANARNIQEVCPRRNPPAFDEVQSGMLKKKAGSGLVFVIRGFGNHVKEDHPKKSVAEQNQVSYKQMETSDQDSILSQISENCLSSEDEELQSIPWSIWQPVVKLSRSCELDALARELCNTDEDSQIGDNSQKQHQNSKISGSKFVQSSSQEANIKSVYGSLKPMKDAYNRMDNDEVKSGLKRKDLEKKVEVEKKQSAFIRNLSFESPKKHAIDSQKPHSKLVHEKSFDATLQQIDEVEEKKMQLEKGKSSANFKVLNESLKHIMCSSRSINKEKNLLQPNLPVPTLPLKIKSETNPLEKRKEDIDVSTSLRKEKAKSLSTQEDKAEIEGFLDCIKDEPKSSASGMQMSKECNSFNMPEWKDDPRRRVDVNMFKEDQIGNSKISPSIQDFKSKKPSREKSTYISLCSEKDSSSNVRRKKRHNHLFQCEACCRRFSSEKWLSRHCKGVSHTRVENAQRVAVQALLLLLTGDESKSLRPLSEIELANLNNWSSHSAPSPLQVALKELLHPAKDHLL
ncbi:hypothetical protein J437_LFUL015689 [Ladona fulva]|uniref:C2H2-type domain-containing protein n=1 Tax=Ladona fulva TaxID=123851 RepID=A0A8K0P677_LADFU|nr:hypothetical protein J437_LFUL015689 [Ladona fulva]